MVTTRQVYRTSGYLATDWLPRKTVKIIRLVYVNPTAVIFVAGSLVSALFVLDTKTDDIVLVTLFYATIVFISNIYDRKRPLAVHVQEDVQISPDYTPTEGRGVRYGFKIENHGHGMLVNPIVEYRLYSPGREVIEGWTEVESSNNSLVRIEPGERSDQYSAEVGPITDDEDIVDYYLSVRIIPAVGNKTLSDWWVVEIGTEGQ